MTENYLHDVDETERLIVEYGLSGSHAEKKRIEGRILDETIGTAYRENAPKETGFPSGTPLLAALLKLHMDTEEEEMLGLIEQEIGAVTDGFVEVADFGLRPLPYAAYFDLMDYADYFESRDPSIGRYFRLRTFEELGAFDDKGLLRHYESENGLIEGLSEILHDYLRKMHDSIR
ncbi:hypothetical protein [Haloprofundus salinisoli]|uniref:hypothetical protein n=1 Tax=Haloprofundus salinisoli TaxID=2876193 RepID=UPI001CCC652F|nr:hypothetical protein [Haloprofundus salinisoli]